MQGSHVFDLDESGQSCKARLGGFLRHLSPAAMKDFDTAKCVAAYPTGGFLFFEGQEARGVFLLCAGDVKLSISSNEGKTLILRIAKPGEILGLMPTMTGTPYEVTARVLYPCTVDFVNRNDFLRFVAKHPQIYGNVVKELGSQYQAACQQLRMLALTSSVNERLAQLLLHWSASGMETTRGVQVKMPLTHEEIAGFIGVSRETVTRTLSEFRNRRLVALHGSTLMIPSRAALQSYVNV
jgi:CRP/FNR family transcriptional regulator